MSMNLMDSAEKQFNAALEVKFALSFLFWHDVFVNIIHVFNTCTMYVVALSIIRRLCSVYVVG